MKARPSSGARPRTAKYSEVMATPLRRFECPPDAESSMSFPVYSARPSSERGLAVIEIVADRHRELGRVARRIVDPDQAVRRGIGERAQDHAVEHEEDQRVDRDGCGQHEDRHAAEPAAAGQRANRVAEIRGHAVDPRDAERVMRGFQPVGQLAGAQPGPPLRRVGRQSGAQPGVDFHVEVKLKLLAASRPIDARGRTPPAAASIQSRMAYSRTRAMMPAMRSQP